MDETPDRLGETLTIPATDAARAAELRVKLPQFARPGEERRPMRDLPFVHRFHTPENPDGSVIVLLHGTGGNEADLMPLAAQLNPRATLLGVRGRSTEEGITRWFRRFDAVTYDQDDIRAEAEAFAGFVEGRSAAMGSTRRGWPFWAIPTGPTCLVRSCACIRWPCGVRSCCAALRRWKTRQRPI